MVSGEQSDKRRGTPSCIRGRERNFKTSQAVKRDSGRLVLSDLQVSADAALQ